MMHRRVHRFTGVCVAALAIAALLAATSGTQTAQAGEPPYFAIKGARIVTVSGAVIENGTVVIANGLITAVGANVTVPPEAWVIDGKGMTVYPGLIDAMSDVGLQAGTAATPGAPAATPAPGGPGQQQAQPGQLRSEGPEDRPGTTPWENVADSLRTADRRIETWRNAGFTTTLATPSRGIFPGQGAVINLGASERVGELVVRAPAALRVNFSGAGGGYTGYPGSLMGVIAYVKQVFVDTQNYASVSAAYDASPRGKERPAYDRSVRVINGALRAERPVLLPGNTAPQMARAVALADEFKLKAVIYGGQQGYATAETLAAKKYPVLVSLRWPERQRDGDPEAEESLEALRFRDRAPSSPAALQKAGVKFAFYSDGITTPRDMLRNAKRAIDAGLPADAAIRALTLSAAEILGVSAQLGSIEPGKVANLIVTDGDLFGDHTRVKFAFVDGRKFDVREEAPAQPQGEGHPAGAANITGRWTLIVDAPDGSQTSTADLRQNADGSLSGTMNTQYGSSTISRGAVTGNRFSFTFPLDFGQGPTDITISGTVEGNTMRGTVGVLDQALDFTGTKPGGRQESENSRGGAR